MPTILTIDPVTRLEGHLRVDVQVDYVRGQQQVVDARATGTLFRGFETLLQGRAPEDAEHITQRICGVCPVAHGQAAVLALEKAYGLKIPRNARIMRNLINGANFVQSHILHFYHLAAVDYINGPAMPPWQPSWNVDRRIDAKTTAVLIDHYVKALDMTRMAHEMGAIYGGRMPAPVSCVVGGFSATATAAKAAKFKDYLRQLIPFIRDVYLPDVQALASIYEDYYQIGGGYGNLLAYGVFELNESGTMKLLRRGRVVRQSKDVQGVNLPAISEHVTHSWYSDATDQLQPANGQTVVEYPKGDAYSWLKAPRYATNPYEVGPLARMWVNGDYQHGVSVMDRHAARALECWKIALAMNNWINSLTTDGPVWNSYTPPNAAAGAGLTEAPRGALGHWVQTERGKISRYQIITPTCWNASPRDAAGKRGPMEQALIGTPVQDIDQPTEVVRVIHSFDPCLSCAVHVMRPDDGARIFRLGHYHTAEDVESGEHCHVGEDAAHHDHDHHHDHSHGHTHAHSH